MGGNLLRAIKGRGEGGGYENQWGKSSNWSRVTSGKGRGEQRHVISRLRRKDGGRDFREKKKRKKELITGKGGRALNDEGRIKGLLGT